MLNKPTKASRNTSNQNKSAKSPTLRTAQHGNFHRSCNPLSLHEHGAPLLDVPGESLTHITSYLDVPTLLNLSRVNKSLHEHVDNDSTWYRALLCQSLGISPESELRGGRNLALRRTESTWKKEFIHRHITTTRWERSRTSTITYSPLTGQINDIRLVAESGLLALSTQYGVVSRSNPLRGKVFRGFLDAAGTLNGLGIGNPNAEFSPNVCLCRIFTERSVARILWGFTHGEIAVTSASRVADPSRTSPAKFSRSLVSEQHGGVVTGGVWGEDGDVFVTAGMEGRVKLWDVAKMRCLWTSPVPQDLPIQTSHPSCLDFDSQKGIVAAAFSSGEIFVWSGLSPLYTGQDAPSVNQVTIHGDSYNLPLSASVSNLALDTAVGTSLLLHYSDSTHFHRLCVDLTTGEVESIKFGDETNGPITSLKLITTTQSTSSPFVMAGDQLGLLCIYDWNPGDAPKKDFIQPVRQITAFGDGDAVSSIVWNPWVTATGSSTGTVKVWDSLRLTLLRTFQPQARGHIGAPSIALEREMIVIAFGDKITTWKAGPVKKGNKVIHVGKKGKNNTLAKWRHQMEMHRDISESQREIEEEQSWKRAAYRREKDQLGSLEALGLNEQEALDYVLMLSRDEERLDPTSDVTPTPPSLAPSRHAPSSSNVKVQISPRRKAEVWSVGVAGTSGSPEIARSISTGSDLSDETEFPTMNETTSSHGNGGGTTIPVRSQRSSRSPPSAWSTPLKTSPKPEVASPKRVAATVSLSPSTPYSATGRTERCSRSPVYESQEDRDLKLAIELSLTDAT